MRWQAVEAIRLIALTGCRRGEIQRLRRTEVDQAGQALRLGDTKTGYSVRPIGLAPVWAPPIVRPIGGRAVIGHVKTGHRIGPSRRPRLRRSQRRARRRRLQLQTAGRTEALVVPIPGSPSYPNRQSQPHTRRDVTTPIQDTPARFPQAAHPSRTSRSTILNESSKLATLSFSRTAWAYSDQSKRGGHPGWATPGRGLRGLGRRRKARLP
jgi:hypothetical protein